MRALDSVGLADKRRLKPNELSGGKSASRSPRARK
jgi:ABC-type ATPase involved in cell division